MSIEATARRPRRRVPISAFVTTLALAAGAPALSAQGGHGTGHRVVFSGETNPGLTTVSPRSGAVGTVFKLAPRGLPANVPVQIMMGALRDGFEVVQTSLTDEMGRVNGQDTVQVTVPGWVTLDRAYLVMVTDMDYNPLAAADMFHPTDPNGVVKRRGTVKWEDPACATLTAEGGEIYFLVGDTRTLSTGADVIVEGAVVEPGTCGNATTLQLHSVRPHPQ